MHEIQMLGLLEHDVLSSIEVPFLPEADVPVDPLERHALSREDADKFDIETFSLSSNYISNPPPNGAILSVRANTDKRNSRRLSTVARIDTIEESPKMPIQKDLPPEPLAIIDSKANATSDTGLSISPSRTSIHSASEKSMSSKGSRNASYSKITLTSKLAPSWLFNPFRSGPSEPQATNVSASASTTPLPAKTQNEKSEKHRLREQSLKYNTQSMSSPTASKTPVVSSIQQIQPMAIRKKTVNRTSWSRVFEDDPHHKVLNTRRSPVNTPPGDGILSAKRRSAASLAHSLASSTSPGTLINPTRPQSSISYAQACLSRRWQHIFPRPVYKYEIKWTPIVTPGCLPLTVDHFPSSAELESSYDVFSYEFIVDPSEMRSFLVKPPQVKGSTDDLRRAWALVVMRGMAAVRLSQGFQFITRRQKSHTEVAKQPIGVSAFRRTKSFVEDDHLDSPPAGAAEILNSTRDPVYLSITNEIHRISYNGETIQVKRYVRRMKFSTSIHYKCLIWPKLGGISPILSFLAQSNISRLGRYTEHTTEFKSHGLENYGWNR